MTKTYNSKFAEFLYDEGDRISLLKRVLAALDHPDMKFKIIHVCGTNGKGSTAIMIANILKELGIAAGLFTSPAIGDVTDTIRVNMTRISIGEYQTKVAHLEQLMSTTEFNDDQLSKFEADFIISMMVFAEAKVDYVVLECGLGGELDATNAVTTTMYSIFTKISLDHLGILGDSLAEIATTKSKIIRPQNTTIMAPNQQMITKKVIQGEAKIKQADLIDADQHQTTVSNGKFSFLNQEFEFGLKASYEQENLNTVLCWLSNFKNRLTISEEKIATAVSSALGNNLSIPGRFELVTKNPAIILDAAHNPDGVGAFVKTVADNYSDQPKIIINGFLKDKDFKTAVSELLKLKNTRFIITNPRNESRELNSKRLDEVFYRETGITYPNFSDPIKALDFAIKQATSEIPDAVIFVVGSFYLINPIRESLTGE